MAIEKNHSHESASDDEVDDVEEEVAEEEEDEEKAEEDEEKAEEDEEKEDRSEGSSESCLSGRSEWKGSGSV